MRNNRRRTLSTGTRMNGLVSIAIWLLFLVTPSVSAQEFSYKVKLDRLTGTHQGVLTISDGGVTFSAKRASDSRSWTFTDIRMFEILSSTRLRIWTYQNRKLLFGRDESLTFDVVDGQLDKQLSDFLRAKSGRALVTVFGNDEGDPLARIPVKHLHRLSGCQGILKVYADRLVYEADDGRDTRFWRWTDIRSVSRPDLDRLEVQTFEPQTAGPNRSFNFLLKEDLAEQTYDLIWSHVFRPTPLIRVAGKTADR
jgi:hypothetical protein